MNNTEDKKKEKNIDINDENIGYTDRLPILRERESLTQEKLAERINVSTSLVTGIENHKKKLTLPTAIEIAQKFKVSLDWLYGLTEDTGDCASDRIIALKELFDIDFEKKCIKVEDNLFTFIEQLSNAYKIKARKSNNVSDEAFKYWIEGIKKAYDEKTKSDKFHYYQLQSTEEYQDELLEDRLRKSNQIE